MIDYETKQRLLAQAKNYGEHELDLFIAEVGWEDWMNNFTEAEYEDEVISEKESEEINKILTKIFKEAHNNN